MRLAIIAAAAALFTAPFAQAQPDRSGPWTATWGSSPAEPGPRARFPTEPAFFREGLHDSTVRNLVRVSLGGERVRIRVSNRHGATPLTLDAASLGVIEGDAGVAAGTLRVVTFSGSTSVRLAPGAEALSDPVGLGVRDGAKLAVNLYTREGTETVTAHLSSNQRNLIASGDATRDAAPGRFAQETGPWLFLAGVETEGARASGVIVALGDSITDGAGSTNSADRRWPDYLAARLRSEGAERFAVVNAGISGNAIANDTPCFGVNALARINDDVVARTGATHLVVLEGINDIQQPFGTPTGRDWDACGTKTPATFESLTAVYRQLVARGHAHRMKVIGATLPPYKGWRTHNAEAEALRVRVNDWIRTSGTFDGVIDFDKVTADPADPTRLRADYDSGDHLHPSDAGYEAMARSIDLDLFR
jgi:lysophospholipase L1-like esterase